MLAGLSLFGMAVAAGLEQTAWGPSFPKVQPPEEPTMDPRRKPESQTDDEARPEGPALQEQDWEAIESGAIAPDSIPENGDLRYDVERSAGAPEEDDDNPYQNSDEALPEDGDETVITRNPSKEGGRFDEV